MKPAGKLIPAYRLAESQELKKAAVARAEVAERRVIELEGALKYQREELAPGSAGCVSYSSLIKLGHGGPSPTEQSNQDRD
jgi:hypothetical protein